MKQRIETAKNFIKENKQTIAVIGLGIVGGITGYVIGKRGSNKVVTWKGATKKDADMFREFLGIVDKIRNGSQGYVPIQLDEFKTISGGHEYIRCGNGQLMHVVGLIAFGEEVKES